MNEIIGGELIENTYLFCLKRISDSEDAKDLSQDILCEALAAIRSGKKINDFYAWYWRMARNKYADYVRVKKNPELPVEAAGGMVSDAMQPVDQIIAHEDISALNYALSRLAVTQREMIVRYYLKEQSVAQIARELGIPAGTVKRRLFDARRQMIGKEMKERMENMEKYGKASYAPAEVDWFCGYAAGEASNLMRSNIAQQAAVICRGEAVSVNDIADEIGVAPAYLEPVLEQMEKVALLKKEAKNRYQTNVCVFPKQTYNDAKYAAHKVFCEHGYPKKISGHLSALKEQITALDFYGRDFDYSYLKWILYVYAADLFGVAGMNSYVSKYANKYPDEAERTYRITIQYNLPEETFVPHNIVEAVGWSNLHQIFSPAGYGRLQYANLFDAPPFPRDQSCDDARRWEDGETDRNQWVNGNNIGLLMALAENPGKELNAFEEETAAQMIRRGLLEKDRNGLRVTIPIIDQKTVEKIHALIENVIRNDAEEFAGLVSSEIEKILLPYVRKDLMSNFIHWDMRMFFQPLNELFYYGMHKSDDLMIPKDYARSAAGLYIMKL